MPSLRCLFLASGTLVLARAASAQPAPNDHRDLRLSWVRSASAFSCPDVGHVEADVEQRLGWSPFVRSGGPFGDIRQSETIEASVTRDNDLWHAAIEMRAADGTSLGSRDVQSPAATCASLAAAAGLAIALMIDPVLPAKPESTTPVLVTPPKSSAAASSPEPGTTTPSTANRDGATDDDDANNDANGDDTNHDGAARGSFGVGAVGVAGILPRTAVGVTMTGSARLVGRLFGTVAASFLPEQHLRSSSGDVGFGMTLAAAGPCYRIPIRDGWSISTCMAFLLGSLQVTVMNPEPVAPGGRFWWGASAGLRLGWKTGPFEVALGVDALGHITRHSYSIAYSDPPSSTSVFVEPPVSGVGSLVAGVHY